jgi:hypothetical protein
MPRARQRRSVTPVPFSRAFKLCAHYLLLRYTFHLNLAGPQSTLEKRAKRRAVMAMVEPNLLCPCLQRVGITRGRNYLYLIFVGMETVLFGNMLTEYRFLDSRTHSWPACFQRVPDAAAARASFVVAANCVCRLGSGTLQTCVALTPSFIRRELTTTRRRLSKMLVVRRLQFRCWWTLKQPISSTRI